ncbi:hypothetical protein [Haloplanus halobius]|nr:hypothetical protein [Haloplanus sp. XH21]
MRRTERQAFEPTAQAAPTGTGGHGGSRRDGAARTEGRLTEA